MAATSSEPERPRPGTLYWPAGGPARGHIGLLHGILSDGTTWWAVGPLLAQAGWDVTAVDLPGHGHGPAVGDTWDSVADMAHGTAPLLPGRLTVLVGHSLGAVVAAAIGAEYPDLAAGVVLVEPPSVEGIDMELYATGVEAEGEAARADPDGLRRRMQQERPQWDEGQVDRTVAARGAADTAAIARVLRSGLQWDTAALVDATAVPVLVIAAPEGDISFLLGGSSALIGPERKRLTDMVPAERFVVVDGGGHSLQRDQPKKVAELVVGFADELSGSDNRPGPERA